MLGAKRLLPDRECALVEWPCPRKVALGLLSYGVSLAAMWRQAGTIVAKVLKAKPADLPVEQPTKFELAVNARTAKALGIAIPPSVLVRADDLFE
jgi:putative tryptophan/tyrosine transport system substrate-binding protein